jgi:hypothetical protein
MTDEGRDDLIRRNYELSQQLEAARRRALEYKVMALVAFAMFVSQLLVHFLK